MQDRDSDWLTAELVELIAKGAHLGHDLAFVRGAPLETVATFLGVHAHVVDHARDCLEDPDRRERIMREYVRASERPPAPVPSTSRPPPPNEPTDVIGHAERHPLGVQFLLCAPLETVAISFGIHPDLVSEARAHLASRGITPEPGEA
jgi:hypothetical protein